MSRSWDQFFFPAKLQCTLHGLFYLSAYRAGGTSERRQDGQFHARRHVVVVSMNYRLRIFGFLVHPGLTAESPHHASSDDGLMDQAAAIQWVKRNIAAFGCDPANITLFGESAGSFCQPSDGLTAVEEADRKGDR